VPISPRGIPGGRENSDPRELELSKVWVGQTCRGDARDRINGKYWRALAGDQMGLNPFGGWCKDGRRVRTTQFSLSLPASGPLGRIRINGMQVRALQDIAGAGFLTDFFE
jgi:hypothetical protein